MGHSYHRILTSGVNGHRVGSSCKLCINNYIQLYNFLSSYIGPGTIMR